MKNKPIELPALLQAPVGDPDQFHIDALSSSSAIILPVLFQTGSDSRTTPSTGHTVHPLEQRLLEDCLAQQFRNASLIMRLA